MKRLIYIFILLLPSLGYSQDLRLFYLNSMNSDSLQKGAFISLTDERVWTEETMDIATKVYQNHDAIAGDYLELKNTSRTAFLKVFGLNESDTIFIYNMYLDTIFTIEVNEVVLIEKFNAYFGTEIGFKISDLDLKSMGEFYWNTFVYIGNKNPFEMGNVQPMIWNPIDKSSFPQDIKNSNAKYQTYSRGETFQFKTDDFTYFVQDLKSKQGVVSGRNLLVIDTKSNEIVCNSFYMDTESTGLAPLISDYENVQWTGKIFKNKPTMIYGFLWISFGCPSIDFVDEKEPSISIYCDNRH